MHSPLPAYGEESEPYGQATPIKKLLYLIRHTTLATIMVTFYPEIAYPLVTVFYWAKHNPKDIFESTLDLCTL